MRHVLKHGARVLKHNCMNCTYKHLSTVISMGRDVEQLGHLNCALNHSGIVQIDQVISKWFARQPIKDLCKAIVDMLDLDGQYTEYNAIKREPKDACKLYLATAYVIATEIVTGYDSQEYHTALLGNLSLAQDEAVKYNIEYANTLRSARRWLYPDGTKKAVFKETDLGLIKELI